MTAHGTVGPAMGQVNLWPWWAGQGQEELAAEGRGGRGQAGLGSGARVVLGWLDSALAVAHTRRGRPVPQKRVAFSSGSGLYPKPRRGMKIRLLHAFPKLQLNS